MIVALVFLPVPDLGECVDTLEEYLHEELQLLFSWFEESYISRPDWRGHSPPVSWRNTTKQMNIFQKLCPIMTTEAP